MMELRVYSNFSNPRHVFPYSPCRIFLQEYSNTFIVHFVCTLDNGWDDTRDLRRIVLLLKYFKLCLNYSFLQEWWIWFYLERQAQSCWEDFGKWIFWWVKHDGSIEPGRQAFGQVRTRSGLKGCCTHQRDILKLIDKSSAVIMPGEVN